MGDQTRRQWAVRTGVWVAALAAASLEGCGSGDGSGGGKADLRVLHAARGVPALDVVVQDQRPITKLDYAGVSAYTSVQINKAGLQLQQTGTTVTLMSTTPTMTDGGKYTLIVYGDPGALKTSLLPDNQTKPDGARGKLLVLNLAPQAGTLDVYITAADLALSGATAWSANLVPGNGSGFQTLNSGSYRVRITGAGDKNDLRLDLPAVTLTDGTITALVLTGSSSGVLVNAVSVRQDGVAADLPTSLARVRLVAALPDATGLAALLGDTALLAPGTPSPVIGDYRVVPAGALAFSLSIAGQNVPTSGPTLAAGSDNTLLLWGSAAAPKFAWLMNDNNRLPAAPGNARVRLIHGVDNNRAMTLSLDYRALASDVQPGTSSVPLDLTPVSNGTLTISPGGTATGAAGGISLTGVTLQAGGVYTVFALGDPAQPAGAIRRDR